MASTQQPLWTPAFVALTVSDLVYFTAAAMVLTVTPFFAESLGAGRLEIGLAMGAFSATTLVARPLVGRWCDRRGRRWFLVAGALAFGAIVAAHLLVESVAVLVIARLALGAAEAMFFVAGFAMLADLAPPSGPARR